MTLRPASGSPGSTLATGPDRPGVIRGHRKAAASSAAAVAAVVGLGAAVVPRLGDWLDAHPLVRVASAVGLVALLALFWLYLIMDAAIVAEQNRGISMSSDLAAKQQELEAAQAALREAETQLTLHDRALFGRWLDIFPPGVGMRVLLRSFYPRVWRTDFARAIETFVDEWIDCAFVDPEMQAAYSEFYEAAERFNLWLGDEGYARDNNPDILDRPKPQSEHLLDKWYADERRGSELAMAMADRSADLEQLGHTRGL